MATERRTNLDTRLAGIFERSKPAILERLDVLEGASAALLGGTLGAALRNQAAGEAHKLAGSLGTFGLHEGTRLAREIESSLRSNSLSTPSTARRFAELTGALRTVIEGANATDTSPENLDSAVHC